ncbi:hypothetical protein JW935_21365 [candidate division KSB1 bacterium]|nr:hypothetical protein [candidate division KSB1 bacterium]
MHKKKSDDWFFWIFLVLFIILTTMVRQDLLNVPLDGMRENMPVPDNLFVKKILDTGIGSFTRAA